MRASLEFLLGLLDSDGPAAVAQEDIDGPHAQAIRLWRQAGFLSSESLANPVPGCPRCSDGVPYRLGDRHVCNRCRSGVAPRELLLWPLDQGAFLRWLAGQLGLRGGVRRIDAVLWQLGTREEQGEARECFYRGSGPLSGFASGRLDAYRNVLVFYGLSAPPEADVSGCCLSLLEVLRPGDPLQVADVGTLLRPRGAVRFDEHSGALWAGQTWLGEVPYGSKEYFFLRCLASYADRFVPYADVKREILLRSGSRDETDEATFCQNLKSRIKKKWIPEIDRLLVTTNKADGYRLRGHAGP